MSLLEEAKEVAEKVANKIEGAEDKAVKFATEARIDIKDSQKLVVTKMENEFLKSQMEMQRLQTIVQNIQKQYPAKIEEFVKEYAINTETHIFNATEGAFLKKQ